VKSALQWRYFGVALAGLSIWGTSARAQTAEMYAQQSDAALERSPSQSEQMPGMEHQHAAKKRHVAMHMRTPASLIENVEQHMGDGTSVEPNSTPVPMLMRMRSQWMLMLHGNVFINAEQQSGPRGYDKVFSTNWAMGMAQHELGGGTLTFRAMLTLEPATVTQRQYAELFQTGETAFNRPIVDGQHPHDFFMELGALYDRRVGERTLLSFYVAPHGDPALGPTAYPHRASASEDPIATLGHHLQDSTHIAADVLTFGVTHRSVRVEASGFHGREPDEQRWDIDSGGIDSWSARLSVNPGQNWSMQYSVGSLHSPEEFHPDEDLRRMTASVMYSRPLARGNWASTLLWGRNRSLHTSQAFNGYLLESTLQFATKNRVWTRVENVDRTSELLFARGALPAGFQEAPLARVQAYSFGYDRDILTSVSVAVALGGQVTAYGVPDKLAAIYGDKPAGVIFFLRVRPSGSH
jgi:hypothetical protein